MPKLLALDFGIAVDVAERGRAEGDHDVVAGLVQDALATEARLDDTVDIDRVQRRRSVGLGEPAAMLLAGAAPASADDWEITRSACGSTPNWQYWSESGRYCYTGRGTSTRWHAHVTYVSCGRYSGSFDFRRPGGEIETRPCLPGSFHGFNGEGVQVTRTTID